MIHPYVLAIGAIIAFGALASSFLPRQTTMVRVRRLLIAACAAKAISGLAHPSYDVGPQLQLQTNLHDAAPTFRTMTSEKSE